MPQDLTDDKSTLVQVMALCRQATSHYLNQCWPRSSTPYGVTRPQWVKLWYWSSFIHVMSLCLNVTLMLQNTHTLKSKSRHDANFVIITGSTGGQWPPMSPVSTKLASVGTTLCSRERQIVHWIWKMISWSFLITTNGLYTCQPIGLWYPHWQKAFNVTGTEFQHLYFTHYIKTIHCFIWTPLLSKHTALMYLST